MSGEGYSKIAKALRDDIGMTKAQSQRVARTEAGRAMSQAGLDSAKVAKDNGLDMKKRWLATKDNRTRDTHRHLDGKAIDIDDNFHSSGCVGQAPKLFVGVASAKENINCRCKLLYYSMKMSCLASREQKMTALYHSRHIVSGRNRNEKASNLLLDLKYVVKLLLLCTFGLLRYKKGGKRSNDI